MRTTLTLDPDVAAQLKELARSEDKPFKQVVNERLRRGMAPHSGTAASRKPFRVIAHHGGFRPGVDRKKLNQLVDELETEDFLGESASQSSGQ